MLKKILYYLNTKPIKKVGKNVQLILYNEELATCIKENDNENYPSWRIDLFYEPDKEECPNSIFITDKNYRIKPVSFTKSIKFDKEMLNYSKFKFLLYKIKYKIKSLF